jgi:hypothetical protein
MALDAPTRSTSPALPDAVDVAENMGRFVFAAEPVFDDGLPAYGNSFITQGFLYPENFLDGSAGVLANGAPAAPEAVIGTWTCRGTFIADGAHTASGPMVITTQYLDFYGEPGYEPGKSMGNRSLVTEGYELMEVGRSVRRAITGGTGGHALAPGRDVSQEFIGLNASEGVNLRIQLDTSPSDRTGPDFDTDTSCADDTSDAGLSLQERCS